MYYNTTLILKSYFYYYLGLQTSNSAGIGRFTDKNDIIELRKMFVLKIGVFNVRNSNSLQIKIVFRSYGYNGLIFKFHFIPAKFFVLFIFVYKSLPVRFLYIHEWMRKEIKECSQWRLVPMLTLF